MEKSFHANEAVPLVALSTEVYRRRNHYVAAVSLQVDSWSQGLGYRNAGISEDEVATIAASHLFGGIREATVLGDQEVEGGCKKDCVNGYRIREYRRTDGNRLGIDRQATD